MRDTPENLYLGKITPNEQDVTPGSVLADAMDCAEQCEEKLTALLEGEEKILLLRLLNAENEIGSTLALENFVLGFRLRTFAGSIMIVTYCAPCREWGHPQIIH